MTDRLDSKIRAFTVELIEAAPEPPPFPEAELERLAPSERRKLSTPLRPRWQLGALAAAGTFVVILLVAGLVYLVAGAGDDRGPVVTAPPPTNPQPPTTVPSSPHDLLGSLGASLNEGDLAAVLSLLASDARCLLPTGADSCVEHFGFFVEANARLLLNECRATGDFFTCEGRLFTDIHDALGLTDGISLSTGILIQDGLIRRFNITGPFTGDPQLDERFFSYLAETGSPFFDQYGAPQFSADAVADYIAAASEFVQAGGSE